MSTEHLPLTTPPVSDVSAMLSQLTASEAQHLERRKAPRYAITKVFWIQPVDAEGKPCSPRISAITRDISIAGAALLVNQPIAAPFVLIEDPQGGIAMHITLRIVRTRQLTSWCFEVAGEFVN